MVAVFTAADIPGANDVSPIAHDDRLLADGEVIWHGQPVFLVAATSMRAARIAARLGKVLYEPLPALISTADAHAAQSLVEPTQTMARGDADAGLAAAPHRAAGRFAMGGQDHFYLEGQIAYARPCEDGQVHVVSSTQHPSEIQHLIAHMLDLPSADVVVEVRRMGGGFGGKESQPALFACAAALVATKTGRPAKFRCDRDDDMIATGKRHDFEVEYEVGFDDDGHILALRLLLLGRCGCTLDLSPGINDRAMFHADNCYFVPDIAIVSERLLTHTVSATAFRGFGGPQGMLAIERVIEDVAARLGRDPLEVRRANLYGPGRDVTPYGMRIEDNIAPPIIARLAEQARYAERRAAIAAFNARSKVLKKGIALTPVKFGISFTDHPSQPGRGAGPRLCRRLDPAQSRRHRDGAGALHQGRAGGGRRVRGAGLDRCGSPPRAPTRCPTPRPPPPPRARTSTAWRRTTRRARSATGWPRWPRASSGVPRRRCASHPRASWQARSGSSFADAVPPRPPRRASRCRPPASTRRRRSTTTAPAHKGRPFYYFAYGAAVSEVVIDTLTGEHQVLAVDILHDVGRSLNPAIDLGQIEGGFIQGRAG